MTAALALALLLSRPPGALCTPTSLGFDGYIVANVAHCQRHVTEATKKRVLARDGVSWQMRGLYEVDHMVPLCLGGSNDLANLWAEPWAQAHRKDVLEARLCRMLKAGSITQEAAVVEIRAFR